jgi:hypothetical protein
MKRCPHCNSIYRDDSLNYCTQDGTPLVVDGPAYADTLINAEFQTPRDKAAKHSKVFRLAAEAVLMDDLVKKLPEIQIIETQGTPRQST